MKKALVIKPNIKDEYFFDEGCFILELSNSDNDSGLSIAQARVEPGITTQLHKLDKTIERYVIVEGTGEVILGESKPIKVGKNDVVIIPENHPQSIHNTGNSDLIFLVICTPRFKLENYIACDQ